MQKLWPLTFAALAYLALAPCARGQLRWRQALPAKAGSYNYEFTVLACWHNVATVAAIQRDDSARHTDNYWEIVFFRSTDGGETWSKQDSGLPHSQYDNDNYIRYLQEIDSLHAVAMSDSGVVIVTTDGGNTWLRRDLPVAYNQKGFHFSDPNTGIVTLWSNIPNNIYTTSDGGVTWNRAPWEPWLTATMCHSDGGKHFRVVTASNGPLYYTSDDWSMVDSTSLIVPHSGPGDTEIVGGCDFRGDTLVAFGIHRDQQSQGPLIVTSTDNGVTWVYLPLTPKFGSPINCMSSLDGNIVYAGVNFGNRHLYKSIDHGMSWLPDTLAYSSDTTVAAIDAIGTMSGGNAVAIFGLTPTIAGTELMVGEPTNGHVTIPVHSPTSVVVCPNPAGQTINIEFLRAGERFDIFDILGRSILRGTIPEDGSLTLDLSSLPTGLYYLISGSSYANFVKQ